MTRKFCIANLYCVPRVPWSAVIIALEVSSTMITAFVSSYQKLEVILVDGPVMPTVCTSLLQQVLDKFIWKRNYYQKFC